MKPKPRQTSNSSNISFKEICENANDMIQCVDTAGKFAYVNKRWLKTLGYSLEASRKMTFVDILSKDQIPHSMQIFQELMKGISSENVETVFTTKEGKDVFVEGSVAPWYEGKKIIGGVGIFRDITVRKRIIEELNREKENAQQLLNIATVMIVGLDRKGSVTLINKYACAVLEHEKNKIIGKNWFDNFLPEKARDEVKLVFRNLLKGKPGKYDHVENMIMTKSGEERIIEWHNNVVKDGHGKIIGTLSSGTDITKHRKVEIDLRNSEEKFKTLFEYAPDAYYIIDQNGMFLEGNKMAEALIGFRREELIGKNFTELNLLPPSQMPKAAALLSKNVIGRASEPDEFILNRSDGTQVCAEIRTYPMEIGGKQVVLGVARDISKRKKMEQDLKASEKRYKELVEKADVAILIDDIKGNFKYFNRNFADLFGYTHAEMRSKSIEQLVHQDDINKVARYHRERLKGREIPKKYEFKGVKKDGTPVWLEVNVVVLEEGGEVVGTRAYIWDVSERKGAEQELRTLSMVDELTGLYNRRGFSIFAEQQIRIADRTSKGFFIVFADLDRMKWINDTLGHKEGDKALKDVANVLGRSFRKSDVIARMGGDEFAVVAVDALKSSESIIVGRMLKNISLENSHRKKYDLAISVGAAYYDPAKACTLDDLLTQADQKMYEHKKLKQELTQDNRPS
jgi:diguanylate cyclase (GGDEF)-like protein/PAS domain S-box-containing protein